MKRTLFMLLLGLLALGTFRGDLPAANVNVLPDKLAFQLTAISAGGNSTTATFTAIGRAQFLSAQFRGVGTSPNYKVEVLCSLDEANFVKPETGGTIGTFTDQNYHVAAIVVPFCKGMQLKFTELGGVNTITPDGTICSQ